MTEVMKKRLEVGERSKAIAALEAEHMAPGLQSFALYAGLAMARKDMGKGVFSKVYKSRVERNEELLRALLLRDAAQATPTPDAFAPVVPGMAQATPSPSPTPTASTSPANRPCWPPSHPSWMRWM